MGTAAGCSETQGLGCSFIYPLPPPHPKLKLVKNTTPTKRMRANCPIEFFMDYFARRKRKLMSMVDLGAEGWCSKSRIWICSQVPGEKLQSSTSCNSPCLASLDRRFHSTQEARPSFPLHSLTLLTLVKLTPICTSWGQLGLWYFGGWFFQNCRAPTTPVKVNGIFRCSAPVQIRHFVP